MPLTGNQPGRIYVTRKRPEVDIFWLSGFVTVIVLKPVEVPTVEITTSSVVLLIKVIFLTVTPPEIATRRLLKPAPGL